MNRPRPSRAMSSARNLTSGTARLPLVILACAAASLGARQQPTPAVSDSLAPVIDHHQHFFSPAVHNVRVFAAANERRMAIVVHMRSSVTAKRPYGAPSARAFLNDVLPFAPDVPVQIAHLAGAGGYDDPAIDEALAVFVDAIANGDPRMKHVYFDASGIIGVEKPSDKLNLIASRIRQIGVNRVLYGSDGALPPAYTPKKAWEAFRRLPLTDEEFKIIANNRAPYMEGNP